MRTLLAALAFVALCSPVAAQDRREATMKASEPLFACAIDYAQTLAIMLPDQTPSDTIMAVMLECSGVRDAVIVEVRTLWGEQYPESFSDALDAKTGELAVTAFERARAGG